MLNFEDVIAEIENRTKEALQKSASIVLRAAKENCPVQTGNLRRSIAMTVEGDTASVFTNVEYAPYVEVGTSKMEAEPFLLPALEENKTEILRQFENII